MITAQLADAVAPNSPSNPSAYRGLEVVDVALGVQVGRPEAGRAQVTADEQPDLGAVLLALPRIPLDVQHRVPGNLVVLGRERVADLELVAVDVELTLAETEVLVQVELDVAREANLDLQLQ